MSRMECWLRRACAVTLMLCCFTLGASAVSQEPVIDPAPSTVPVESTSEQASASTQDPSTEPTTAPTVDPTTEPTAAKPTEPTDRPATEPEAPPVTQPTTVPSRATDPPRTRTDYTTAPAAAPGAAEPTTEPIRQTKTTEPLPTDEEGETVTAAVKKTDYGSMLRNWIWLPILGILLSLGGLIYINVRHLSGQRKKVPGAGDDSQIYSHSGADRNGRKARHGRRPIK